MKIVVDIGEYEFARIKEYFDSLPEGSTVDADRYRIANGTPLPKGHWDSRTCKCSECGYQIAFSEYAERKYNFCPNCGADMRGEQE